MQSDLTAFIDEIKTEIRDRAHLAMISSKRKSAQEGYDEFQHYYDGPNFPALYSRTGQLGQSLWSYPTSPYKVDVAGDNMSYSFYIKEPYYGPAPNGNREKFLERGYPSTAEGYRVINATNEGYYKTYLIKGHAHYWDKTLKHIEANLDASMKQLI